MDAISEMKAKYLRNCWVPAGGSQWTKKLFRDLYEYSRCPTNLFETRTSFEMVYFLEDGSSAAGIINGQEKVILSKEQIQSDQVIAAELKEAVAKWRSVDWQAMIATWAILSAPVWVAYVKGS
ncbi:uncharacterized protein PV09_09368 [Verruconis gallopava]|uniref:Uncharacterized protein n=1 Tax=Verruconis gallopava TaxID=253628 RepID=A0A0D1ZXS1_9PEZI|nr:uncharacterized protein PV09_09368 [Verruconis gallopava]KIV98874.1 hypothetical protein PV09_09368 [Verruconis gallopava]